jgi:1-acyl-sn-glycerol-3-phosphate acyltransferase
MLVKPHQRPSEGELTKLSRFERQAFNVIDTFNSVPLIKNSSSKLLTTVGGKIVRTVTRRRTHLVDIDRLRDLKPDRGVLIVANHRTYYDHYLISAYLESETQLIKNLYYPVRSNFFYDTATGVAINLFGAAMSMYPPVFRQPEKRDFNHYGLRRIAELLQDPRAVVGVHPEGRRNSSDDPYTFPPAQPGVGKLVMKSWPLILPVFVNGFDESFLKRFTLKGMRAEKNEEPLIIVYGEMIELTEYRERPATLRLQKEIADELLRRVGMLGQIERRLRERLRENAKEGPRFYQSSELLDA